MTNRNLATLAGIGMLIAGDLQAGDPYKETLLGMCESAKVTAHETLETEQEELIDDDETLRSTTAELNNKIESAVGKMLVKNPLLATQAREYSQAYLAAMKVRDLPADLKTELLEKLYDQYGKALLKTANSVLEASKRRPLSSDKALYVYPDRKTGAYPKSPAADLYATLDTKTGALNIAARRIAYLKQGRTIKDPKALAKIPVMTFLDLTNWRRESFTRGHDLVTRPILPLPERIDAFYQVRSRQLLETDFMRSCEQAEARVLADTAVPAAERKNVVEEELTTGAGEAKKRAGAASALPQNL